MPARDLFSEITTLRARNPRKKGPFDAAMRRLEPLKKATHSISKKKRLTVAEREFLRFTPVGVVACLEGYFKGLMCDLIDLGPPFLQNAVSFKEVKVTLEGLVKTQSRHVSVGELLTHSLRISSLEDINHHMSIVLGDDFLKTLRVVPQIPEKELANVAQSFEMRHIVAHEIAHAFAITPDVAFDLVYATFAIIFATEHYVQNTLLSGEHGAA
jgi:hypothetical protein